MPSKAVVTAAQSVMGLMAVVSVIITLTVMAALSEIPAPRLQVMAALTVMTTPMAV